MRRALLVLTCVAAALALDGCTGAGARPTAGAEAAATASARPTTAAGDPASRASGGPVQSRSASGRSSLRASPASAVRAYFLGDSWSAGSFADPAHTLDQVAAARLGWIAHVDAIGGTGYLNGADSSTDYASRAAHVRPGVHADVVVVQGGSNDVDEPLTDLPSAIDDTVHALEQRFPGAHVVLLGPGPDPFPASATERTVDRALARAARRLGATHVSMLDEHWITAANVDRIIDPDTIHPTVAGQQYLGERLATDLAALHLAGAG